MNRILLGGAWVDSEAVGRFSAHDPSTGTALGDVYPVSSEADVETALAHAEEAVRSLRETTDDDRAHFLRRYGQALEARRGELVDIAHLETALPKTPRLEGELSRTIDQLDQAAEAVVEGSWARPVIDTTTNIRSMLAPLEKPVVVFGPNNFPFAFNGVSGGDFAAAIAAGNPVIVKGHPAHPTTTRLLGEAALESTEATSMPDGLVQLLYHVEPQVGLELVSNRRVGAVGFTGSQRGGLALKRAADGAGVPIYLEMGSINPVFLLDDALATRGPVIAEEFFASCTLGAGQYCTNPGMVVVPDGAAGEAFARDASSMFAAAPEGVLLGPADAVSDGVAALQRAGAEVLAVGPGAGAEGFRYPNTLLTISAKDYLADPVTLQREVFGPVSLLVRSAGVDEMVAVAASLEGNLTGGIYADEGDESAYDAIASELRPRVGRLLNDKMPTGVAVVASMNHGGPYPATGHPGFTSVGLPTSISRFAALHSYDNVPEHRLPAPLRNPNPSGVMWRYVDGEWTRGDID